jgi:RHS repeat-associated protein
MARFIFCRSFILAEIVIFSLSTQAQPPSNKPSALVQVPAPVVSIATTPSGYIVSGQNPVINYVRNREAQGRITDENAFAAAAYIDVQESTSYMDGLGRPLQTVRRQITPGSIPNDLAEPICYDPIGREAYKYLSYSETTGSSTSDGKFKLNPFVDQAAFYQSIFPLEQPSITGERAYYSQTNYESSPVNRVLQSLPPGNSWAGSNKGVSTQYLNNILADAVQFWTVTSNSLTYDINGNADVNTNTNIPATAVTYDPGQLSKTVITDEQGNATVQYTDKNNHVILKKRQAGAVATDYSGYSNWLCTYYIYDDLGQLRFIIPPKAVATLISGGWNISANTGLINELCFRYEYDERRRIIAKKAPGTGWIYMIYDQRDRLVFVQDADMRGKNQWLTTLYEGLNRPVMTGMMIGTINAANLQATVNTLTLPPTTPNSSLVVDLELHTTSTGTYQALRSITMDPGMQAIGSSGNFVAQIVSGAGGVDGETTVISGVAVNSDPIPAGYGYTPLKIIYYDEYTWTVKAFTAAYNSSLDAGTNLHAEALPSHTSVHTRGTVTGSKVRTLENANDLTQGVWMSTVNYFDDRGRLVQIQSDNYRGGNDITTNQYNFTGKLLSKYLVHTNPVAGTLSNLHVKVSVNYDAAGRPINEYETVNDDPTTKRLIAQMSYDQMGELKQKQIGQKTDGSFLEVQDYTYNLRGWLKGINKDYANNDNSKGADNRWFGLELNYDWGFASTQFGGNIAGTKWRSKGDGQQRAYGFGYDPANRLLYGDFSQFDGQAGAYTDNSMINFDMLLGNGIDPTTAYDENGNIKAMKQWGLKANANSLIDNLTYTYITSSNKLMNVIDAQNDPLTNLGDFRTSSLSPYNNTKTAAAVDYYYDVDGNLTRDLNKDIGTQSADGIIYNYLNMPCQIIFQATGGAKGSITYVYDADGNKLKKTVVDNAANLQTNTIYIGGLIYQSQQTTAGGATPPDILQSIATSEGRTRPLQTITNGQMTLSFNYDYFIKDHLGNTRMILTDQQQQDIYPAVTLEGNNTPATDPVSVESSYYSINTSQIVFNPSGIAAYVNNNGNPPINNNPNCSNTSTIKQTDNSQKVYMMNVATTAKTGLGITLKVMSGDRLDIFAKSYYTQNNTGGQAANLSMVATDIITGLLGAPGSPATTHVTANQISSNTAGAINPLTSFIITHDNPIAEGIPRAYINYVFFDDQFNYVGGGVSQVGSPNVVTDHYRINQQLNNISAPKNGYVYVFCSNESPVNVYFDNLQLILTHGPLTEETHYYPFGLTMAGLSDNTLIFNYSQNRYKYNGKEIQNHEFNDGSGFEEYDYGARFYDQQIGRWNVSDPLVDKALSFSPYSYALNNPVNLVDPDGRIVIDPNLEKADQEALRRILKNLHDYVAGLKKGKELDALLTLSKFSQKKLEKFLTETNGGPTLTVSRLTYGNEKNGLDDGHGGIGSLGLTLGNKDPDKSVIALDRGVVDAVKDGIESEKTGISSGTTVGPKGFQSPDITSTMEASLKFADRVFEHEITHWGAYYNLGMTVNDDFIIPLFGANLSLERGRLFEMFAFGNLGNPFNPNSNPSWAVAREYTFIQYTITGDRSTLGPTAAMGAINVQLQSRAQSYHLQKSN